MKHIDLSVVVIARNEEQSIGKALAAVGVALDAAVAAGVILSFEVIFVDSASTDQTVKIARQFPVKVIELPESWPLSAAAGIFCGYREAQGTYLAVVDGDVVVDKNWFRDALPYLQADETVANVYGWWEESSQGKGYLFRSVMKELDSLKITKAKEVDFVGNGIFRKSALDSVGGHNPYLKGAEDKDISYRLRQGGFKLLQVPVQFGIHHWNFSVLEYYRSVRAWSRGEGHAAAYAKLQGNLELFSMFKKNFPNSTLWRVIRQTALILLVFFGLLVSFLGERSFFIVSGLAFFILLLQIAIGSRKSELSFSEFLFHYFNRVPYLLFRYWYFYEGLHLPTPPPQTYPLDQSMMVEDV